MRKGILLVLLMLLFSAAAAGAATNDDKDFRAGLKAYNSKHYKDAVNHFKESLQRKPDATAYYLAGYSLYKLGKFKEADEYFREAYMIDPDYSLEKAGLISRSTGEALQKKAAPEKKADAEKKEPAKPAPAR